VFLNSRSQNHPTRCNFAKNPILIPADCFRSRCRRTGAQDSNFDQLAGEDIWLCTKSSEIRTRAWPASGRKSRKADDS
jgi:hypothetical protein